MEPSFEINLAAVIARRFEGAKLTSVNQLTAGASQQTFRPASRNAPAIHRCMPSPGATGFEFLLQAVAAKQSRTSQLAAEETFSPKYTVLGAEDGW